MPSTVKRRGNTTAVDNILELEIMPTTKSIIVIHIKRKYIFEYHECGNYMSLSTVK